MKAPLVKIEYLSIYKSAAGRLSLPERMAKCCPDVKRAILAIGAQLKSLGGELILSDLFRSRDMQYQSYRDYLSGKKKAFSPPPGSSMHEGGRAFDIDLGAIGVPLEKFWEIARAFGVFPIIKKPLANQSEAWHFDCPGSHKLVYDYYAGGKAGNMNPYTAMAVSAIISIGVQVDRFAARQQELFLQSALIRLGQNIGNMDGYIGPKSKAALFDFGINANDLGAAIPAMENMLSKKFPQEYQILPEDTLIE